MTCVKHIRKFGVVFTMSDGQRQLHKEIEESGEGTDHDQFHLLVSEYGQDENQRLFLSDKEDVTAVVKSGIEDHRVAGTVGTETKVIRGKCHRCGCNRLRHSRLEPEGEVWVSCVACNHNNHDHESEQLEW